MRDDQHSFTFDLLTFVLFKESIVFIFNSRKTAAYITCREIVSKIDTLVSNYLILSGVL